AGARLRGRISHLRACDSYRDENQRASPNDVLIFDGGTQHFGGNDDRLLAETVIHFTLPITSAARRLTRLTRFRIMRLSKTSSSGRTRCHTRGHGAALASRFDAIRARIDTTVRYSASEIPRRRS